MGLTDGGEKYLSTMTSDKAMEWKKLYEPGNGKGLGGGERGE